MRRARAGRPLRPRPVPVTVRAACRRFAGHFEPAAESRPAVLAGLINGVAIAAPLPAGLAAGDPETGALATLGSYLAAFTNKGGPRRPRTRGLVVAALVNAAAWQLGTTVQALFPVALVILVVLVFVASMGSAFGETALRLGTMPATALLAGTAQIGGSGPHALPGALPVLFGGLWYAAATAVLTPAPRLKGVLAVLAQPYRIVGQSLAALADDSSEPAHPQAAAALATAEETTRALRGPRGDEHLADLTDPLVRHAADLADLAAALAAAGPPPARIAAPYDDLTVSAARRAFAIADHLTGGQAAADVSREGGSQAIAPRIALEDACDRLRAETAAGEHGYADTARAGRQRRLFNRVVDTLDAAHEDAEDLPSLAATRLHPPTGARSRRPDAARLRAAMRPNSPTFRYALRTTAVTAAVFVIVQCAALPHGSWAALAVLRVMRPQYTATRERVIQRVVGNLVGGTCAALLIAALHEQAAIAVVLFVIITAGFTLRPVNYGFWVVFGTPLVLLIGDVSHPGDWIDALIRIALTVLGTSAALLGGRLLWPDWERTHLADDLREARRSAADYLDAALRSLAAPAPGTDLRRTRATAEKAVARADKTAGHAHREPGHDTAALETATTDIAALDALVHLIAGLTMYSGPQTAGIPAIRTFATHAAPALTADDEEDAAARLDALDDALDEMSFHLGRLHTRRHRELVAGETGETPIRAEVREQEPVIELLIAIAGKIREITRISTSAGN